VQIAIEKATEKGAIRINLLVFEHNRAAVNLYRKMGFLQISIPGLNEQLDEKVQRGDRRRIIMSRPVVVYYHSSYLQGYISKSTSRGQAYERGIRKGL
jgi:hypothetical protein